MHRTFHPLHATRMYAECERRLRLCTYVGIIIRNVRTYTCTAYLVFYLELRIFHTGTINYAQLCQPQVQSAIDWYDYPIPVRTVSSGTHYDGRIWYELLSSIRSINGSPVAKLENSMLTGGDRVTINYNAKTYHSIVDAELSASLELGTKNQQPEAHDPLTQEKEYESPSQSMQGKKPRREQLGQNSESVQNKPKPWKSPRKPKRKFHGESMSPPPAPLKTR